MKKNTLFLFFLFSIFQINPLLANGFKAKNIVWKNEIIYFVLIDRFFDGNKENNFLTQKEDANGYHGGDIEGVIEKINYLKELGVTTVWLSPVFDNREEKFFGHGSFHGYWIKNHFKTEENFGSLEVLKKLSDKLHENDMKLILDMVLNHVEFAAPLVNEKPGWFHHFGDIKDWNDPFQLINHDVKGLPDLAQENPEVYAYLLKMAKWWVEKINPDGFRLDAVKHIPLDFWIKFNQEMKNSYGEDFLLLGEDLNGDPSVLKKFYNEGKFSSIFDFPVHFVLRDVLCENKSFEFLASRFEDDNKYKDPYNMVNVLDNHDLPRFYNLCKKNHVKMELGLAFLFLSRGIPSLYYGSEIPLQGEGEPENRSDMKFDISKMKFYEFIRSLISEKKRNPALKEGIQKVVYATADQYGFERISEKNFSLAVFNKDEKPVEIKIHLFPDAINGRLISTSNEILMVNNSEVILQLKGNSFGLYNLEGLNDFKTVVNNEKMLLKNPELKKKVKVKFVLSFQEKITNDFDFYVIGNSKLLGEWNSAKAMGPLKADSAMSAVFTVDFYENSFFEYKFIKKFKNGKVEWMNCENKIGHTLVSPIVLYDHWK